MKDKEIITIGYNNLIDRIGEILTEARSRVVREINRTQVLVYWEIGREIVEFEQKGKFRGEYGKQLIEKLSKDMTQKFGKGFSSTNLKMMRLFFINHSQFVRHCLTNFKKRRRCLQNLLKKKKPRQRLINL